MSSKERFSWSGGDVTLRDKDGNVITERQALEQQLERLRAQEAAGNLGDEGED